MNDLGEFDASGACVICGSSGGLKELANGYEIYICRNCYNDYCDWKLESEELTDFEVVHESYVMIKRRGLSIQECLDFFKDDRLRPIVDEIRKRRQVYRGKVRSWVRLRILENRKAECLTSSELVPKKRGLLG